MKRKQQLHAQAQIAHRMVLALTPSSHKNPKVPYPFLHGEVGRRLFAAAVHGTTIDALKRIAEAHHGSWKYWRGLLRRGLYSAHRWRWMEDCDGNVRIVLEGDTTR